MTDFPERLQEQARRIQAVRDRTGLSVDDIADRILIKRETMRKYAKGYQPASDRLMRMIEQLRGSGHEGSADPDATLREEPEEYVTEPRSILKKARESKGWSHEELAKLVRVPAGFIRDVESGQMRGSNEKALRKLAKALELDPEELLRGSDHPPVVGEHVNTFGATPKVALTDKLTAKTIPLISMAQAGDLKEWEDVYDYEGVIAYAGRDPRAIAVRIRGESMSPDYGPGTIAILYPSFVPKNDNLVVAKVRDGSVLFKRLQIVGDGFIFHSINPKYEPMKFPPGDIAWMYPVGLTQRVEL